MSSILPPNLDLLKQHYDFDSYKFGSYCVWVTADDSEVGLKLFFREQYDPKRFLGISPPGGWELMTSNELQLHFELLNRLYSYDLHPKAFEIFSSDPFHGIIIGKASPALDDMWANKELHMTNISKFEEVLGRENATYMKTKGIHNYGMYEGKLMALDVDYAQFTRAGPGGHWSIPGGSQQASRLAQARNHKGQK